MKLKLGIIPDGNRKWALKNKQSWDEAYQKGAEVAIELVEKMLARGNVERAVFFGLSQENVKLRPPDQIQAILTGVEKFITLAKKLPVQISCYGNSTPQEVSRLWLGEENRKANPKMQIDLLLNYAAAWDLERIPIRTIAIPPLDLIIRTSGSAKLSGFLPWQSAYANFLGTIILWPDFTADRFNQMLDLYERTEKRPSGA